MADHQDQSEDLIRRHQSALQRYLLYLGCDANNVEDLTQEAFLALLRAIERRKFTPINDAATFGWLRQSARHALSNHWRKKSPSLVGDLVGEFETLDQAWDELSPHGLEEERLANLALCRQELDADAQAALDLRYDKGATSEQIAEALGSTSDAARSLLKRTRAKLRQCLEHKAKEDQHG